MSVAEAARSRKTEHDIAAEMAALGADASAAAQALAASSAETRRRALRAAAAAIRDDEAAILEANAADMAAARESGLSGALLDRLALDPGRVAAMAAGVEQVAALDDPLGRLLGEWERPNGLRIRRVSVPIGVIGIIYESRPNVTSDAGALCLMAGNAAILRGGSESYHSSRAIAAALRAALVETGLPAGCIQLVPTTDRAAVGILLTMDDVLDLIVPRGGRSLIERVLAESRVPVMAHLDGNCHVYVHAAADPEKARDVTFNAKMRRTGICGAAGTLLVDAAVEDALPAILEPLFEAGCEIRGDARVQALDSRVVPANAADWGTEYLDAIISVALVDGLEAAIAHVNEHGSHHTDAIITEDSAAAERFMERVDSGIVLHNASTQFADGGEFGMGAEIGISTGKLHARGPVGVEQLTTYKYKVYGTGQVRPDHARPHAPPAIAASARRHVARAAARPQDRACSAAPSIQPMRATGTSACSPSSGSACTSVVAGLAAEPAQASCRDGSVRRTSRCGEFRNRGPQAPRERYRTPPRQLLFGGYGGAAQAVLPAAPAGLDRRRRQPADARGMAALARALPSTTRCGRRRWPYSRYASVVKPAKRFARRRMAERRARGLVRCKPPAWIVIHGPLHPASATALRAASGTAGR